MAHIHIAATPGVTIDGFRAVSAKHSPPQALPLSFRCYSSWCPVFAAW